jgi:hypothetical protein
LDEQKLTKSTTLVSVFVIAAVRRYMRFFQFRISDAYIAALTAKHQKLTEFVEVWATPWFDLKNQSGRRNAADNVVALVRRQPHLVGEE